MEDTQFALESPFHLASDTVDEVCSSVGFQILRTYLANDLVASFCADHVDAEPATRETWLLHRDILHALIMPVVQLYARASALAEAALCSRKPEELELAYRGDARTAFLCLQCLVADEEEWCFTRGCPACVVTHTLSTEPTIRAAITSALLSSTHTPPATPAEAADSDSSDYDLSQTSSNNDLSLPDLSVFLPAIENAVCSDGFWGPDFYAHLYEKSVKLHNSLYSLIEQCTELAVLVESSPNSPSSPLNDRISRTQTLTADGRGEAGCKIKRSRFAKRQQKLEREEKELLARAVWQVWSAQAAPASEQMKTRENQRRRRPTGAERRRSMTCP
ncbi:hypothetical protein LTS18_003148 [Coniosporium uncinatum]|uniref:Uncharacterized protein n=1 Tax=Coniosporium uncinatum TaxID=93489 RepID=A0ACC3DCI6_9PEZI|nr:hypothetical protein LTS18_003148 [Coniosporium uncinatum]